MDIQNNTPLNPSLSSLLWKIVIWIIVWIIFAAIIFIMFIWISSSIDQAISNSERNISYSPLVWLSFLAVATIIGFLWSVVIAWIYNIIRNEDYYDMKIMSSSILTINLLLLIPFLILYAFVWTIIEDIIILFIIYWFHLFFAIYVSFLSMDIVKNPNYSAVYVVGNSFGFIIAILIFFIIYSIYNTKTWSDQKNILFFPPILAFSIIPFISTLFEKLYYKFYEMWNDILYIPSLTEVMVDEEELDDVNVDIK